MSFSTQFSENTSSHDRDLATLSNYHDVRTTHLDLTWSIDWTNQLVSGLAVLKLEATKDVRKVILDTSHLDISTVRVGGGNVKWELGESVSSTMGQPFRVELAEGLKKGESVEIEVVYSTTKECTAVGWLTPLYVPCSPFCGWSCVDWWKSQTKSGKYPYLYSQCQSVSTRAYTAPPFAPLSPPFPFVSRPAPPPSTPSSSPSIPNVTDPFLPARSTPAPSYPVRIRPPSKRHTPHALSLSSRS